VSVDPVNASFVEAKKYMITHCVLLFWPFSMRNTRNAYLVNIHVTSKSSTSSRTKTRDNIHDTLRKSSLFNIQWSARVEKFAGYIKKYSLYIICIPAHCMLNVQLDRAFFFCFLHLDWTYSSMAGSVNALILAIIHNQNIFYLLHLVKNLINM
jgi:hypothetical protein